jgi:hypothetical protein
MCRSILKRCPSDASKYTGIGATVFFTGILAVISSGYALYTIFDSTWRAVLFGLLWGCMIFNLDRFIVSSMKKRDNFRREFKIAVPRLVLAILIALVISKPLELKIFEKEINRQIDVRKNEEVVKSKAAISEGFPEITELETKIAVLKAEITDRETFRNQRQQEYDDERFGEKTRGTTGIRGIGTNAKKREIQLDAAEEDLKATTLRNRAKIDAYEKEITALTVAKGREFETQKVTIDQYDGLAARMEALGQLARESDAIRLADIFIILLFIAIETAPIFVKLISERGPYDHLLEVHEHHFENYKTGQIAQSDHQMNERIKRFTTGTPTQAEPAGFDNANKALQKSPDDYRSF